MAALDDLPPLRLMLQLKEGLEMLMVERGEDGGAAATADTNFIFPQSDASTSVYEWSPDGKMVALSSAGAVSILNGAAGGQLVTTIDCPAKALHFSPRGTYLLTWQSPIKQVDSNGRAPGNLVVWEVASGTEVLRLTMKLMRSAAWPAIKWTKDEAFAMRGTGDQVQIYCGNKLEAGVVDRISVPKLASFSVAPGECPYTIATFVPEMKGLPGKVSVYRYPSCEAPLCVRSSFRAQEADFRWSPNGASLICLCSTDVDATGQSYYGSTGLFLMSSDGSFDCQITSPKDGPVHDVQWCPGSKHQRFAVVAGTMPAQTALYNSKGEPTFQFGEAHRNTLLWSPHGRFLCLAGVGNLAGEMDFWDCNKLKLMGSNTSHCAVKSGWSPDSRLFMTATCAPRMNQDNAVKLFRYNGEGPLQHREIDVLLDSLWVPAAAETYPDRPQSPGRKGPKIERAAVKKAAAYRPPNSSGSLADRMRAERSSNTGAKKVTRADLARNQAGHIPGMGAGAEKKSRNQKKKEAKKKAEEAQKAREQAEEAIKAAAPVDVEKKKKAINKKLRALDAIKAKSEAGEDLNADQLAKLATEQSLREELAGLGFVPFVNSRIEETDVFDFRP